MEGVKLFDESLVGGAMGREEWLESEGCKLIADDLKKTLEGMCDHLFGECEKRWIDEYFPFTEPSFELEIFYDGDWMEARSALHSALYSALHSALLEIFYDGDWMEARPPTYAPTYPRAHLPTRPPTYAPTYLQAYLPYAPTTNLRVCPLP